MEYKEIELTIGNTKLKFTIEGNAASPSFSYSHAHTNFELFYVWRGEVKIKTDKDDFIIKKGEAMLVAPACYHQTITVDGSEKINLYFSFARNGKQLVGEDLHKEFERVFSHTAITQIADAEEFGKRIRMFKNSLESECMGKSERLRAELTGLVFSLYDLLASKTSESAEAPSEAKVGVQYRYEIDRLLSQNYAKKIDLEFLSDKLCLSPKRVAVLIKLLYGKSFRRVRTEMKIQVAKQLLKESDLTVGEIASRVGYDSVRGFLTAFMQETGKTPTEYRTNRINERRE